MANETQVEDRLNEALDKKEEKLEKWMPEKAGERMLCVLIGISQGGSDDTRDLMFLEVEQLKTQRRFSILQDTVLRRVFEALKVREGDLLGLEFLGWQDNKKGKIDKRTGKVISYKNWKVVKLQKEVAA